MIDLQKLNSVLQGYKSYFPEHWEDEKYKWEAVKHFQEHWDIDAENFGEMFEKATEKTKNLLTNFRNYPRGMILSFAGEDDEATREMFRNLFDESLDLAERVETFKKTAKELRLKYGADKWRHDYQLPNAISTYLWLRYPDKYYVYQYGICQDIANDLSAQYTIKRDGSGESMVNGFKLYDEICQAITEDEDICKMIHDALTPSCYPDPMMKTATIDVGYYLSKFYSKNKEETEWYPSDYQPNISVEEWISLLKDPLVFTEDSFLVVKRIKSYGGEATCKELSIEYGESPNFYNRVSTELAKRIAQKTNCTLPQNTSEKSKWWPILYTGKRADSKTEGNFVWKLRPELSEAFEKLQLNSSLPLNKSSVEEERNYWWLNANPRIWSFSDIENGAKQFYTILNENGHKRRIYSNFLEVKAGDLIIGYESNPVKKIVALGEITKENDGEKIYFKKTEDLITPIDYSSLREYPELEKMEFFINPNGSLFKLTHDEYNFIMDLIRESNPLQQKDKEISNYSKEDFLDTVFMSEENFEDLTTLLKRNKNVILEGPPGVGKTFSAKRLAYAMMGEIDDSRIEFVQFHQNYSYEDFVMGIRPEGTEFNLKEGIFYRFRKRAANDPEKDYFFIIDEINRGNLSKIFGELLMLIEKDYRGEKATLAYSGTPFSIPENLYIIGMMNTADRSLALIDYALRRRFSFYKMYPNFDSEMFVNYQEGLSNENFDNLIEQIKQLNRDITNDMSLGKEFQIGHSYFCNIKKSECTDQLLRSIVKFDILPMLNEYWFDDPAKVERWEKNLLGIFDD